MNTAPWGGRHVALRAVATLTGLLALSAALSVVPIPSTSDERVVETRERAAVPSEPPNFPADQRLLLTSLVRSRSTALVLTRLAHSRSVALLLRFNVLYAAHRLAVRPLVRRSAPRSRVPAPTPVARSPGACWGWLELVQRHFGAATVTACAVLGCESRGDPNADNRSSTANGLFQILGGPFDPEANVALARSMYAGRGWQPWDASRGCWN